MRKRDKIVYLLICFDALFDFKKTKAVKTNAIFDTKFDTKFLEKIKNSSATPDLALL